MGSEDGKNAGRTQGGSGADAHARAAGRVAVAAADWRSGADGEAGSCDSGPRRRRWRESSAITWCSIRDSGSESASRRIIRCWRTLRSYSRWDFRCSQECRESRSLAERLRAMARMPTCRTALRNAGSRNRADPERDAHHSDTRCALCRAGGARWRTSIVASGG